MSETLIAQRRIPPATSHNWRVSLLKLQLPSLTEPVRGQGKDLGYGTTLESGHNGNPAASPNSLAAVQARSVHNEMVVGGAIGRLRLVTSGPGGTHLGTRGESPLKFPYGGTCGGSLTVRVVQARTSQPAYFTDPSVAFGGTRSRPPVGFCRSRRPLARVRDGPTTPLITPFVVLSP